MIDLHCHILPGMDDGAGSIEDTKSMFRHAKESGISLIAATSHYSKESDSRYAVSFEEARKAAEEFEIRLLPGCEYDLVYLDNIPVEKLRLIGETKYLLVDMNQQYLSHSMVNLFFKLKLAGFQIVFAHPERLLKNAELDKLLALLKENAIIIQVDTGSIVGRYGELAQRNAFHVLDAGGCHLLANDAHKSRHFLHGQCRSVLEKRYGKGVYERLTEYNPQALLSGGELIPMEPRKSFFQRLFHK